MHRLFKSKPVRLMKFVERVNDSYLPLISVAILVIGQLASYAFAAFCIVAYFFCVIAFNECEIQNGCDPSCPRGTKFKFIKVCLNI